MHWYISATAVRQYMAIMGYEGSHEGPVFDAAAIELERLVEQAKLTKDSDATNRAQKWRVKTKVRGKSTRLEFTVTTDPRPEGPLPQLVAVRNKGK